MIRLTKEQEQLVNDNLKLAYLITNKYAAKVSKFLEYDDVLSICYEALVNSALHYDITKNIKFSTYACNAMIHGVFNEYNKQKRKINDCIIFSLDEAQTDDNETLSSVLPSDFDLEGLVINSGKIRKLYMHIYELPELSKTILLLRLQDKNFNEIAQICNKNVSCIYSQYQKALAILRNNFKGDNYD